MRLSDDGGGTWREIAGGMQHWGGTYWGWVDDIEIDPSNRDHIMHITGGPTGTPTDAST